MLGWDPDEPSITCLSLLIEFYRHACCLPDLSAKTEKKLEEKISAHLIDHPRTIKRWPFTVVKVKHRTDTPDSPLLKPFLFEVQLQRGKEAVSLRFLIPPTIKEMLLGTGMVFLCAKDRVPLYKEWAMRVGSGCPVGKTAKKDSRLHRTGERWSNKPWNDPNHAEIIDFAVDRLAARIQALVYALPDHSFTVNDQHRLSWAAFEIGKLLERQIAYSGNTGDDPVPLTSVDFFNLPISSSTFIDDFRGRRRDAESITEYIKYHAWNTVENLGAPRDAELSSRVKDSRKDLERLGQRYEGFIRGNLAMGFVLLHAALKRRLTAEELEGFGKKTRAFWGGLNDFCSRVEKAVPEQFIQVQSWLKKCANPESLRLDLFFSSPPLPSAFNEPGKNKIARVNLCENLREVKFLAGKNLDFGDKRHAKRCADLIYRCHDAFAVAACSLLLQLENLNGPNSGFAGFYSAGWDLLQELSKTQEDLLKNQKTVPLANVFGFSKDPNGGREAWKRWNTLVDFLATHQTGTRGMSSVADEKSPGLASFCAMFGLEKGLDVLGFTPEAVFKRLRTVAYRMRDQRSTAHLAWDLRKFDLLGTRIDCLFKHQTFALYEEMWNSGDPFYPFETSARNNFYEESGEEKIVPDEAWFCPTKPRGTKRFRWFCLRTNVNPDEPYNALQIAALADPGAIRSGFWGNDLYKIGDAKRALRGLLEKYEDGNNAFPAFYRKYAFKRNQFRHYYAAWLRKANDLRKQTYRGLLGEEEMREDPSRENAVLPKWFGRYFCQSAVEVMTLILSRRRSNFESSKLSRAGWFHHELTDLAEGIRELHAAAVAYSCSWLQRIEGRDEGKAIPIEPIRVAGVKVRDALCGLDPRVGDEFDDGAVA